jgi:branched-chain amino acid transport system permease protein
MSEEGKIKEVPKKFKVKFGDKLFFILDKTSRRGLQVFDDIYTPYFELCGIVLHRLIYFLTAMVAIVVSDRKSNRLVPSWVIRILGLVLGIPLLIVLFLASLVLILIGGAIASVVGLRNLGEYTFVEQVIAWSPLCFILILVPFVTSTFFTYNLGLALALSVVIIGLDFLIGQCGILTLGHSAFVMLGGYFTIWLNSGTFGVHVPFFIAVLLAALATSAFSVVLAIPSLRVKDHYLVVVTIAFMLAVPKMLKSKYLSNLSGFKEGGLAFTQPMPPESWTWMKAYAWQYYYVLFPCLILIFISFNLIHRSQIGRAFRAIKCDEEVASIMGVSVIRYKLLAFALSAFFAACGGGLMLVLIPFIGPDSHTLHESVEYIIGTVIGGPGSVLGGFLGGVYLASEQGLAKFLADLFPKGQTLLSTFHGVVLILTIYFVPNGLARALGGVFSRWANHSVRRWQYYINPPPDYDVLERKSSMNQKPKGENNSGGTHG